MRSSGVSGPGESTINLSECRIWAVRSPHRSVVTLTPPAVVSMCTAPCLWSAVGRAAPLSLVGSRDLVAVAVRLTDWRYIPLFRHCASRISKHLLLDVPACLGIGLNSVLVSVFLDVKVE